MLTNAHLKELFLERFTRQSSQDPSNEGWTTRALLLLYAAFEVAESKLSQGESLTETQIFDNSTLDVLVAFIRATKDPKKTAVGSYLKPLSRDPNFSTFSEQDTQRHHYTQMVLGNRLRMQPTPLGDVRRLAFGELITGSVA